MGISALSWAFQVEIRPASLKLILISLADGAGHDGEVFPSIKCLENKTCLDRKTIIKGLDKLEESGVIADTGKRVGTTNQVKVYRLVGLDLKVEHYVYRVQEESTGRYYIGVRTSLGKAERDIQYMGSGTWPQLMLKCKASLSKSILSRFKSRKEADLAEKTLIREHASDPLCMNRVKNGTVPLTTSKSTTFSDEESQKRYTDPNPITINTTEEPASSEPTKQTRSLKVPYPDDFSIIGALSDYALQRLPEVDIAKLAESFKGKAISKGWKYACWRQAFQEFVRNCAPDSGHWASGSYPRKPRMSAWKAPA